MLDPGTPNRKENEMNARPSRTHVFDTAPTLTFFLQLWKDYGEPARVEISHALHHHFLTSARSGDYRGWLDSLDSGAIAADEMLGDRALWFRSMIGLPKLGEFIPVEPLPSGDELVRRKPTTFNAADIAAREILKPRPPIPAFDDKPFGGRIKNIDPPVDRKSSDGKLAMNLVTSDLTRQAAAADTYGAEKYRAEAKAVDAQFETVDEPPEA